MVDQVTFPTSIGGSGRTYTNDANPDTGMFNGGHRVNFFPVLSDTIAAAGYVAQYAQAIDGAKANADKAEDAKGYVEAVADAYKVNILEQYRAKATLDLDFARGLYRVDDGTLTQTTNAADVLTIARSTPKWAEGSDGFIREEVSNNLAREWRNGVNFGASFNSSHANLYLHSGDLTNSAWFFRASVPSVSDIPAPFEGEFFTAITPDSTNDTHRITQDVTVTTSNYSISIYIHKSSEYKNIAFIASGSALDTGVDKGLINISTLELLTEGQGDIEYRDYGDYLLVYFSSPVINVGGVASVQIRVQPSFTPSLSGWPADGVSKVYMWGGTFRNSKGVTPYIPTAASAVTVGSDAVSRSMGSEFNKKTFSVYSEFYFDRRAVVGSPYHPNIRDNASSSRVSMRLTGANTDLYSVQVILDDSTVVLNSSISSLRNKNWNKVALSYSLLSKKLIICVNGNLHEFNDVVLGNLNQITIADGALAGRSNINSRHDLLLPIALTDTELQELTE